MELHYLIDQPWNSGSAIRSFILKQLYEDAVVLLNDNHLLQAVLHGHVLFTLTCHGYLTEYPPTHSPPKGGEALCRHRMDSTNHLKYVFLGAWTTL